MSGCAGMRVRIGVLRLLDSAPAMVAEARGLFHELGLAAEISVEPSWANIADKLSYGLLDAAVMLPPLALAASLGIGRPPAPLIVPMGISLGGNSVTIGRGVPLEPREGEAAIGLGRRFVTWMRMQTERPRLAVVHSFSTHNLLLRYWLAASGAEVDRDFATAVVPPEHVVHALADERIAGFCAGAPWGDVAVEAGAGRVLLHSAAIWNSHPEKCLAVAVPWATVHPEALAALLRALLRAGALCDDPDERPWVAHLLAQPAGLGLSQPASRAALCARDGIAFSAGAAWFPWRSHALWFLRQMRRWGWLDPAIDLEAVARAVYRPELLAGPARAEGLGWPFSDRKREGGHPAPWRIQARPRPLEMRPDLFCNGVCF